VSHPLHRAEDPGADGQTRLTRDQIVTAVDQLSSLHRAARLGGRGKCRFEPPAEPATHPPHRSPGRAARLTIEDSIRLDVPDSAAHGATVDQDLSESDI
jgi:hypothetical protein